ncbi:MAG: carbamate kinase [Caldisphaeraceae archaeon]|nr:carbamate kinase [Caldisphaeraceae archaeon]MEB3692284.1 carbamate kinase [Caldisphaeraceae archaeon]MEB3798293.1 carbamate kinase [Caldisphaeraceae archaeon]
MKTLIALGGNAIQRKGEEGSVENQWRNVRKAVSIISEAIKNDSLVVTHGNGPQVGYITAALHEANLGNIITLDIADAMTQGWIGYMLQHCFHSLNKNAITIPTRVVVLKNDPAFLRPTKFVGKYYSKEEAEVLSKTFGWIFKQDPRGGYRRVVPSPMPIDILEIDVIKKLLEEKYIVIAVGGGGIPVIKENGKYSPVEAVIDKDLASSLLARKINADRFIILTDVNGVALNYGKENEEWIEKIRVKELRELYDKKMFPEGSMGPKVLSAIKFVESTGKYAVIGNLDDAVNVIEGNSGTMVIP